MLSVLINTVFFRIHLGIRDVGHINITCTLGWNTLLWDRKQLHGVFKNLNVYSTFSPAHTMCAWNQIIEVDIVYTVYKLVAVEFKQPNLISSYCSRYIR